MYWKDLDIWKKSHDLVISIYEVIIRFPDAEKYALSSQLKRAAYSIPANIVEGHSRKSTKEFIQFLFHARGSLEELRYFVLLSKDLNYLSKQSYHNIEEKAVIISKMLNSLISSLKKRLTS